MTEHHPGFPGKVVVAQHATLWITRRSRSVDQAARLTRLLSLHLGHDDFILDRLAHLEEIFPQDESGSRNALGQGSLAPDDEGLHFVVLVQVACESFEMLGILDDDNLSFGMLCLVKTSIGLVGNVDSSVHIVVHDGSHEGDGPLWRVEAHDGDGTANSSVQLVARLGESQSICPVLAPGPAQLLIIALDPHGWSVTTAAHSIEEHLADGEWCLGARATSAHFHGKLIIDVARPMEALALLGVHQAMVTCSAHLDNAIVRHIFFLICF